VHLAGSIFVSIALLIRPLLPVSGEDRREWYNTTSHVSCACIGDGRVIPELFLLAAGSFVIALSGALMPGPLLTVTISESARRGAGAGPLLIVGHGILEGALVLLVLGGLSAFMLRPGFTLTSFLLGGVILVAMGGIMVRDSKTVDLDSVTEKKGRSGNLLLLGILGSVSNPYWIIWWATVGLGYLAAAIKYGFPGVAAFFTGHIAADFAWYTLVSAAIAKGRSLFSRRGYRRTIFGCGLFLILFGGWFLVEGAKIGARLAAQ
jgi:threonine/homoserine/homoserine lactone efflux protein